jgi:hypothetical protein
MTSSLRLPVRLGPLLWFGGLAALLIGVEYAVVHRADFGQHPALPPAVAFDLLVTLPTLFYFCLVRCYQLPLSTVVAAIGGGLVLSHWLLPDADLPLLAWVGRLAAVSEVLTLGYLALRLGRVLRAYRIVQVQSADFIENLLAAGQPVLGRLTEAVMSEVAMLRYAVLGSWAQAEVGPADTVFTTYQKSGFVAMLVAFGGLGLVEMAAAHLVVGHWYPRVAWLLTGISGYSLLWLLAHGQAVRCRPVLVSATSLQVRVGFIWRVSIAKTQLNSATLLADVSTPTPGLLNAAKLLLTTPNLLLTLAEPQQVRGPYGLQRTVRQLAIYVDEPAALLQELAQ